MEGAERMGQRQQQLCDGHGEDKRLFQYWSVDDSGGMWLKKEKKTEPNTS